MPRKRCKANRRLDFLYNTRIIVYIDMEAFYALLGYALIILAVAFCLHGIPSLITIEKHYYYDGEEGDEPEDENQTGRYEKEGE